MGVEKFSVKVLNGGTHKVTSYFGHRKHPITGKSEGHKGIDVITASDGVDWIVSPASGKVSYVNKNSSSAGCYVVISHGNGLHTRYLHMKRGDGLPKVKTGDKVSKGTIIGYMGNTGQSTGPHLHFDISLNSNAYGEQGEFVDPIPFLKGERSFTDGGAAITPSTTPTPDPTPTPPPSPSNPPPDPEPEPEPEPELPVVTKITQTSSTKVTIDGKVNGNKNTNSAVCYYKWQDNTPASPAVSYTKGNHDGTFTVSGDFKKTIDRPRQKGHISVMIVRTDADGTHNSSKVGKTLGKSSPAVLIVNDKGEHINYVPKVYVDGKWQTAVPVVRRGSKWYRLFSTDSEKV